MTTAVTEAATQAAFRQRYRNRPFVRFADQKPGVQLRWTVVATQVVQGIVTSGRQFRDTYLDGIGAPDRETDKQWAEIGPAERASWNAVYESAVHAADRAKLEAA